MNCKRKRAAALVVALATGAVLAWSAPARADDPPLAADVVPATGIPPFQPAPEASATAENLLAWVERVAQHGRAQRGTRRSAELLYSAASAVLSAGGSHEQARKLFVEAHQAGPESDPMTALAALEVLRASLAQGGFSQAKTAGAWLERWERTNVPVDADAITARRFALVQLEMTTQFQLDAATLLEGLGNFQGAATRLERLAEARPAGLRERLPRIWERAAIDRFRAGEAAEAKAAVAKALEADPTPEERARLLFWLLHMKHGLLTPEGALRPTGLWPGSAYLDDLHETLRDLSGNLHVGTYLLSAASSALLARADEDALALYLLALRDPALRERAWSDAGVVGGLLSAVPVAIRLERFDEGEEILDEIERRSGQPVSGAAALRARVKLAREAAAERRAARDAPPPQPPAPPGPRPAPELLPPAPADETAREAPARATGTDERGGPWLLWLGALTGLALLLWLALRARR